MKRLASGKKSSRSSASSRKPPALGYGLCIRNRGYAALLERRKVYELFADVAGDWLGLVRVRDESGEAYLYPTSFLMPIKLPASVPRATFSK